jgi:putative aldouronate transport system permease protein
LFKRLIAFFLCAVSFALLFLPYGGYTDDYYVSRGYIFKPGETPKPVDQMTLWEGVEAPLFLPEYEKVVRGRVYTGMENIFGVTVDTDDKMFTPTPTPKPGDKKIYTPRTKAAVSSGDVGLLMGLVCLCLCMLFALTPKCPAFVAAFLGGLSGILSLEYIKTIHALPVSYSQAILPLLAAAVLLWQSVEDWPHRQRLERDMLNPPSFATYTFDIAMFILLTGLVIVTVYPFLNTVALSFNDAQDSVAGGITLLPRIFTTYNYEKIFKDVTILNATMISVLRTIVGAVATLLSCLCVSYALSRREYVLRVAIGRLLVMTMYFGGGLIPYYLLMRSLGLVGTFWVYIVPGLVSAWNIMVIRSFITSSIPDSLVESARIDGASEYRILFGIVFPLSLPVIATIVLFVAVGQWNSWFDVNLYNRSVQSLSTLQFELQKVLQSTQTAKSETAAYLAGAMGANTKTVTPQATRAAMTMVATVPILLVYPFLQRFFIHGLTLGGVKE